MVELLPARFSRPPKKWVLVKGKLALLQLDMDKLELPRYSWLKPSARELPKRKLLAAA